MLSILLSLALVAPQPLPQSAVEGGSEVSSRSSVRVRYSELVTRLVERGGKERSAVLRYSVHAPIGTPRALVVLLPESHGLRGDRVTGKVLATPDDVLFHQAPLFAEQGFLTVVADRSFAEDALDSREYDLFRLSAAHGQDLAALIRAENRQGLDVFFVGMGRGTLSVVAQHRLARAIALVEPQTSGIGPTLGDPDHPRLMPRSVTVPVHVMTELGTTTTGSSPRHALDLELDFLLAGVPAAFSLLDPDPADFDSGAIEGSVVEGHFRPDKIDAIDTRSVAKITRFLGLVQLWDQGANPENEAPLAGGRTLRCTGEAATIDLSTLALDPDGDELQFSLPHETSSRGGTLALEDSTVTYTPVAPGITDGFVFGVSDGKGTWVHELVVVEVDG